MFFLTTYGIINLVAGLEKLSGAPSYRPTIDVHWLVSIGCFLACLAVMLLIAPLWCAVAVLVELTIYFWLRRRSLKSSWGDLRYGALIALVRTALLGIKRLPVSPRNWRPHILLFAGELIKRKELARLASWLNQDRGIITVMRLIGGDFDELAERREQLEAELNQELNDHEIPAFGEVVIAEDFAEAVVEIAQANGMGGLESNTLMFGWSEKPGRMANLLRIMRRASLLGKSIVVCRVPEGYWTVRPKRIDVWWGGLQKNGDMMLLFAHLISSNKHWEDAKIRVLSAASNELMKTQTENALEAMLKAGRINAELKILLLGPDEGPRQLILRNSNDADLVFMGLKLPDPGDEEEYSLRLEELTKELPAVVLVRSAGPFAGKLLV
jgi:potassium/chloride transporter 4/5/6